MQDRKADRSMKASFDGRPDLRSGSNADGLAKRFLRITVVSGNATDGGEYETTCVPSRSCQHGGGLPDSGPRGVPLCAFTVQCRVFLGTRHRAALGG
jgi:hypothetical protein